MKPVELDEVCRQQQVDDQCFPTLEDVPGGALTLTIPALMAGSRLFCMVPGSAKAEAVRATLLDPLGERCPSTVLRTHRACTLYLDEDSAGLARGALSVGWDVVNQPVGEVLRGRSPLTGEVTRVRISDGVITARETVGGDCAHWLAAGLIDLEVNGLRRSRRECRRTRSSHRDRLGVHPAAVAV